MGKDGENGGTEVGARERRGSNDGETEGGSATAVAAINQAN